MVKLTILLTRVNKDIDERMNINAEISVFSNVFDHSPKIVSVVDFCAAIINEEYENEVEAVRNEPSKDKRQEIKKSLVCATISGVFANGHTMQNFSKHSGFICVDIDRNDNPTIDDWCALRDTLGSWKQVLFSSLSVSGHGVFIIMPLSQPEKHKAHFLALKKQFSGIGLTIDSSCKNINRLRCISADANAVWNPDAIPYTQTVEPQILPVKPIIKAPELVKLVSWVELKHGAFVNGNRNNFITQLAGAAHRMGVSQDEVESYCKQYAMVDFSESSIIKTVNSIYANRSWFSKAI